MYIYIFFLINCLVKAWICDDSLRTKLIPAGEVAPLKLAAEATVLKKYFIEIFSLSKP